MSNQFLTYLTGTPWQTLPHGYNEPIIHLYRELKFAVREQCDALIFAPTAIVLRRQGQRIHAFSIGGGPASQRSRASACNPAMTPCGS